MSRSAVWLLLLALAGIGGCSADVEVETETTSSRPEAESEMITTERSSVIIRGNTISTDGTPLYGSFPIGIAVREITSADQDDISILNNTIVSGSEPFVHGIMIGRTGQALTGIVATGNTVEDSA